MSGRQSNWFTTALVVALIISAAWLAPQVGGVTLSDDAVAAAYAKAEGLYQRDDFGGAVTAFREALRRFPDSPRANAARLQLGNSLWRLAAAEGRKLNDKTLPEDTRQQVKAKFTEDLRGAAEQFHTVESELTAKEQSGGPLTRDEAGRLRKATFAGADCDFFLGQYEQAAKRYEKLADRHKGHVDELIALSQLWQCATYGRDADSSRSAIERVRTALKALPDDRFDGWTPIQKRDFWERWVKDAAK